jgi:hypothetical protein
MPAPRDLGRTFGINAVLSTHHERNPVGMIKWIYEVTNVVGDWRAASDRYAKIFFGYTGTLTLFNPPERLDRIEISQITDYEKAMGRFHRKRGDSLYMLSSALAVKSGDPTRPRTARAACV